MKKIMLVVRSPRKKDVSDGFGGLIAWDLCKRGTELITKNKK